MIYTDIPKFLLVTWIDSLVLSLKSNKLGTPRKLPANSTLRHMNARFFVNRKLTPAKESDQQSSELN